MLPGSSRNLTYPLDRSIVLENEVPDEPIGGLPAFPVDSDERIYVLMHVSLNEFVILASSIDVGRDPAYPDQSQYVWWLWNRVIMALSFCEEMAACLESENEALMNALASALQNNATLRAAINSLTTNPATSPYGENLPEAELTRDVAAGTNPTCDLDILWSQCLNITMTTNQAIVDSLEKLEVSTNITELVNNLIDAIPLVGAAKKVAGIEGVLDLLNYFQETITESYDAQYTTTPGGVQDQIACALFCACKDDCIINIERLEEVLRARLAAHIEVPEIEDFTDLLLTIAGLEPDVTYVVDLAFWFSWITVRVANFLFGNVFNQGLDLLVALAADEPSNDWLLLCDCGWFSDMDTTTSAFNWIAVGDANFGNWTTGVGFVSGFAASGGNAYQMVQVQTLLATPVQITRVAFDYDIVNGIQDTGEPLVVGTDTVFEVQTTPPPDGDDQTYDRAVADASADAVVIRCQAGFDAGSVSDPGGQSIVKRIRVWGFGTKPSEFP